jgi:hypothetical protein
MKIVCEPEHTVFFSWKSEKVSEAYIQSKNCATSADFFTDFDLNFGSKTASLRFDTINCIYYFEYITSCGIWALYKMVLRRLPTTYKHFLYICFQTVYSQQKVLKEDTLKKQTSRLKNLILVSTKFKLSKLKYALKLPFLTLLIYNLHEFGPFDQKRRLNRFKSFSA